MALDQRGAELLLHVLTDEEELRCHRLERVIPVLAKDLHRPPVVRGDRGRLTFGDHIIETGTDCYRLAHTLAQRGWLVGVATDQASTGGVGRFSACRPPRAATNVSVAGRVEAHKAAWAPAWSIKAPPTGEPMAMPAKTATPSQV